MCAHQRHSVDLILFDSISFKTSNVVKLSVNHKPVPQHKMTEVQSVYLNLNILGEIISSTNFSINKQGSEGPHEIKRKVLTI